MNKCKDCGKELSDYRTIRCLSCANKGINNPNYKNGLRTKKYYCLDCFKPIFAYSKRCIKCWYKFMKYTNNPNYGHKWSKYKKNKMSENRKSLIENNLKLKNFLIKHIKKLVGRGKNNPNWRGGISKTGYSYKFNSILKEQVRKRDNYKCQLCGKSQEQELNKLNRKLAIHHIDYNKDNCKGNNLVTLCTQCNSLVNFNRDYWFAYFMYIRRKNEER